MKSPSTSPNSFRNILLSSPGNQLHLQTCPQNYQIHHKELWSSQIQLWPPTPISESYLAGRGIPLPDKQHSQGPQYPGFPGQPITAASTLPSPADGAQETPSSAQERRLLTAQNKSGGGCQLTPPLGPWRDDLGTCPNNSLPNQALPAPPPGSMGEQNHGPPGPAWKSQPCS